LVVTSRVGRLPCARRLHAGQLELEVATWPCTLSRGPLERAEHRKRFACLPLVLCWDSESVAIRTLTLKTSLGGSLLLDMTVTHLICCKRRLLRLKRCCGCSCGSSRPSAGGSVAARLLLGLLGGGSSDPQA
jgi:hypothetical protein